jgi:hypothetical protein
VLKSDGGGGASLTGQQNDPQLGAGTMPWPLPLQVRMFTEVFGARAHVQRRPILVQDQTCEGGTVELCGFTCVAHPYGAPCNQHGAWGDTHEMLRVAIEMMEVEPGCDTPQAGCLRDVTLRIRRDGTFVVVGDPSDFMGRHSCDAAGWSSVECYVGHGVLVEWSRQKGSVEVPIHG